MYDQAVISEGAHTHRHTQSVVVYGVVEMYCTGDTKAAGGAVSEMGKAAHGFEHDSSWR